jgi:branched-chain amino acid transport system ATP-binding protein
VFALFPALAELRDRRGGQLSGGEQQMLAIARTLMGNPSLLLLDEPGEGLAPLVARQLGDALRELKRSGVSILLAEQSLALAARIADRACVIESGQVRYFGPYAEFAGDPNARAEYLGLD